MSGVQRSSVSTLSAILTADPAPLALAGLAALDLFRYSLYLLVFAVIVQVIFSWVNPYAPMAPVLDAMTRPFLRPLRRLIPPVGGFDLTPLVLLVLVQIVLIVLAHLA